MNQALGAAKELHPKLINSRKRTSSTALRYTILGFRRRRAISTIIGGLIILSLILTALGTMVAISQQYNQYQQTTNQADLRQDQKLSENLVADFPGLAIPTTISGWESGCSSYTCYNMTLSNLGGVDVQVVRVYINSSYTPGCTTPCILNPSKTIAANSFNQANQYINPGEVYHSILIALPNTITLPNTYYSENTIFIVTSRGNTFSFQWPIPNQIFGGQSQSAFSTGILKIAYQDTSSDGTGKCSGTGPGYGLLPYGCDSKNDYLGASKNTYPNQPYCHQEKETSFPAPTNYAEQLPNINGVGVLGNPPTLYFVNPWITLTILQSARTDYECGNGQCTGQCTSDCPTTQMYIYLNVTNTGSGPFIIAGGSIDLTFSGSTHIDGTLIGIYYNASTTTQLVTPQFYIASPTQIQTVAVGKSFYAIFKITLIMIDASYLSSSTPSSMFWGTLSLTNIMADKTFVGGVGLSSGLWVRTQTSSC